MKNIWIIEILCATGYKISEIAYSDEEDAREHMSSLCEREEIVCLGGVYQSPDETVYRIRPLILKGE